MKAFIYFEHKSPTQSGLNRQGRVLVSFGNLNTKSARYVYDLMCWTGSSSTASQVEIGFDSMDDAIRFLRNNGIDYEVRESGEQFGKRFDSSPRFKPKSYADNFK